MKIQKPVVDYRKLRPNNLLSDEFKHLLLLIFWPLFGLVFAYLENGYPVEYYYPMYCGLDDLIPFCEWFYIPYVLWFAYVAGMLLYSGLYEIDAFRRLMKYIIVTYSVTVVIYFLFPTCQELRPIDFPRDNFLTDLIGRFYRFDTHTNVCPSIHVIGSLAVMETVLWSKTIRSKGLKAASTVLAVLICLSTVFMKQHSILDLFAALPLCLAAHFLCFYTPKKKKKQAKSLGSA